MFEIFKKKKEPESKLMIEANEELLKRRLTQSHTHPSEKGDLSIPFNVSSSNNYKDAQLAETSSNFSNTLSMNEQNNQSSHSMDKTYTQSSLPDEFPDLDNIMKEDNLSLKKENVNPALDQILSELKTIRSQNDYILSILQKLEKKLE